MQEGAPQQREWYTFLFVWIISIAACFAVLDAFHTYVIARDFPLYGHVPCDRLSESCFAYTCDEASGECAEMGEDRFFKVIYKNAHQAPRCDPWSEEGCPELACFPQEEGCEIIQCSQDTALDYQEEAICW